MDYKQNFRLNIVSRVILILCTGMVLLWGLLNTAWQATPAVCFLLLLFQVAELIYYVEKTVRQFANFLSFIKHHDFTSTSSGHSQGKEFENLGEAYQQVTEEYRKLNSERELNFQLLDSVVSHISVALLCMSRDGEIILMNQSAKSLFRLPYASNTMALKKVDSRLTPLIEQAQHGEKQRVNLKVAGEELQLAMFTTVFQLMEEQYTLVSFQNIRDELDQREIDAWQKLIRVLTHEIMNSVTPIVSLTEVVTQTLLSGKQGNPASNLSESETHDLHRSLVAIQNRGKGLMNFVSTYTELAKMPKPVFRVVSVMTLLERVKALTGPELMAENIDLHIHCANPHITVLVDEQQIEQVLINLIKNAREAMTGMDSKRITIECNAKPDQNKLIVVSDNGPGISPENLQNIFTPFFTTKVKGSGVGLSISRQIMFANNGLLTAKSVAGEGTEFTLNFRV
jgi:nitrogen fixation/metabolism regulation signal transduction histidine kinase